MQQNSREMADALRVSTRRHLEHPTPEPEAELRELTAYVEEEQGRFERAGLDGMHLEGLKKAAADAKAALAKWGF